MHLLGNIINPAIAINKQAHPSQKNIKQRPATNVNKPLFVIIKAIPAEIKVNTAIPMAAYLAIEPILLAGGLFF